MWKRIALLVALPALAYAAPPDGEDDPMAALPAGLVFARDVAYGDTSDAQRLDILYPTDGRPPQPAIVMIHGGGWYTGDKGGVQTARMLRAFADAGFTALSINYRLSDEAPFPAAVEDCKRAIRWVRAHARDYGVDPGRIGVIGGSAGGHLSAMLAVTRPDDGLEGPGYEDQSSAVQAAVPVCPPCDLRVHLSERLKEEADPAVARFLGAGGAALAGRASPISYAHPGAAPMLLVHGTADARVVPAQSEAMAAALAAAGALHELMLVEGGRHGMGIVRSEAEFARVLAFFTKHLAPAK